LIAGPVPYLQIFLLRISIPDMETALFLPKLTMKALLKCLVLALLLEEQPVLLVSCA